MQTISIVFAILAALVGCTELEVSVTRNNLNMNLPQFSLPWAKLHVPTLVVISKAIAKPIRKRVYEYAKNYSSTLIKHLMSETEVQIIEGTFTRDSLAMLAKLESEMEVLQYRERLSEILGPWQTTLGGQPVSPEVGRLLGEFEGVSVL